MTLSAVESVIFSTQRFSNSLKYFNLHSDFLGTLIKSDISALLSEIGQSKAFGSVTFVTPLKGLTVPECFIRKSIHAVQLIKYVLNLFAYTTTSQVDITNQFLGINKSITFLLGKDKILNHEEIAVLIDDPYGLSPTNHNVSSLLGDKENLLISRFAIITVSNIT